MTSYTEVEGKSETTKWLKPSVSNSNHNKLMVRNSLTDTLEEFIPHEGNKVNWYTCGPTVYNVCHMGHARAYLTFDIIRRILSDYLHYDVYYHVNITDVDDKIILQARRNHLVKSYLENTNPSLVQLQDKVREALDRSKAKLESKLKDISEELATGDLCVRKRQIELEELQKETEFKLTSLLGLHKDMQTVTQVSALASLTSDVLGAFFDESDESGSAAALGNDIFDQHARKYEESFMTDMDRLGVRRPDVLTRVTEYISYIVEFCEVLVDKQLAYESEGSVYMDTCAFEREGHTYRKLKPVVGGGLTSKEELEVSEGALSQTHAAEKRNPRDFVLWKKSKDREPFWESKRWGKGRPGWHIECSVVATSVLGKKLDIHAGGEDLKFPHHDNELCQSEAFHGDKQWVNYFFHAGHLHIKGLKMSKSLKNFVTIEEALERSSATTLRMLFLTQRWDGPFTYSEECLLEAKGKERRFAEFLTSIKTIEREKNWLSKVLNAPSATEVTFTQLLFKKKGEAHQALLNNFDTPACLDALFAIVDGFYVYKENGSMANLICLEAGRYVSKMLDMFGVNFSDNSAGGGESSREAILTPLVEDVIAFRQEVKSLALASASKETKLALFSACDKLRDVTLVEHGIVLQDESEQGKWALRNPTELKREIHEAQRLKSEQELLAKQKKVSKMVEDHAKWEAVLQFGDPLNRPPSAVEEEEDIDGKEGSSAASKKRKQKQTQKQIEEWNRLLAQAASLNLTPLQFVESKKSAIDAFQRGEKKPETQPIVQQKSSFRVNGEVFYSNVAKLTNKSFASVEEYVAFLL